MVLHRVVLAPNRLLVYLFGQGMKFRDGGASFFYPWGMSPNVRRSILTVRHRP